MVLFRWLRLWFLLRDPVTRKEYALTGFGLMAFKYLVEFLVIGQLSGMLYSPLDFINPLISARANFLGGAPDWLGMVWVLWSLPFLWIAVGMSVRRALDAGISPWHGLWMFVPFLNLVAMLMLACLPSAEVWSDYWNPDTQRLEPYQSMQASATLKAALAWIFHTPMRPVRIGWSACCGVDVGRVFGRQVARPPFPHGVVGDSSWPQIIRVGDEPTSRFARRSPGKDTNWPSETRCGVPTRRRERPL